MAMHFSFGILVPLLLVLSSFSSTSYGMEVRVVRGLNRSTETKSQNDGATHVSEFTPLLRGIRIDKMGARSGAQCYIKNIEVLLAKTLSYLEFRDISRLSTGSKRLHQVTHDRKVLRE